MNNDLIKYNKHSVPKFKYVQDNSSINNTMLDGNVFKNNVDRVSSVCDIYAIYIPNMFQDEIINGLKQFALFENEEETEEYVFSPDIFKNIEVETRYKLFYGVLFGNNGIRAGISTIIVTLLNSLASQSDLFAGFQDITEYVQNDSETGIKMSPRFTNHKIDLLFAFDNYYTYGITECVTFNDKLKVVKYPLNHDYDIIESRIDYYIAQLQSIYKNDNLTIYEQLAETGIILCYDGELTAYKSIINSDKYNIILDGYSNDYGSYSNVNNAIIQTNFASNIEERDNYVEFSLGATLIGTEQSNEEVNYDLEGLIVRPIEVLINHDSFIENAILDFGKATDVVDDVNNEDFSTRYEGYISGVETGYNQIIDNYSFNSDTGVYNMQDFEYRNTYDYDLSAVNAYNGFIDGRDHILQIYSAGRNKDVLKYVQTQNAQGQSITTIEPFAFSDSLDITDYPSNLLEFEYESYNPIQIWQLGLMWKIGYTDAVFVNYYNYINSADDPENPAPTSFATELLQDFENSIENEEEWINLMAQYERGFAYFDNDPGHINFDEYVEDYAIYNMYNNYSFLQYTKGEYRSSQTSQNEVVLNSSILNAYNYYDVSDVFLANWSKHNMSFKIKFSREITGMPNSVKIVFKFDNIGEYLQSYVTPNDEYDIEDVSIHMGQYSYTNLQNKTLHVTYFNYDKPNIKISPKIGCFIAGTKILMADGTCKNIEDIQIDDYVMNANNEVKRVYWNQPSIHRNADHYTIYELPNGRSVGVIGDERVLWNGKFKYISTIPEIKSKRIDIECTPYEIWVEGNDTCIANGIQFGKIYSNIKCNAIRWIAQQIYKLLFLHNKDYEFIQNIHNFISEKILKHKIY